LHRGETVRDGLSGRISIGITANDIRARRLFVIFVILVVVLYTMSDEPDHYFCQLMVHLTTRLHRVLWNSRSSSLFRGRLLSGRGTTTVVNLLLPLGSLLVASSLLLVRLVKGHPNRSDSVGRHNSLDRHNTHSLLLRTHLPPLSTETLSNFTCQRDSSSGSSLASTTLVFSKDKDSPNVMPGLAVLTFSRCAVE
jgi:hypothetical protein